MEIGEAVAPAAGGEASDDETAHRICLRLGLAQEEAITLRLAADDGSYDEQQQAEGRDADEAGIVELVFEDVDPGGVYTLTATPDGEQPAYEVFTEVPYARLCSVARSE